MLRRFIYLDKSVPDRLGGWSRSESTKSFMRSGTGTGGVDAKATHASGERSREDEKSVQAIAQRQRRRRCAMAFGYPFACFDDQLATVA